MPSPRRDAVMFRPLATDDLDALYDYVANAAGRRRAQSWLERIEAACMALETFPERGTVRADLYPGLRIIGLEHRVSIAFVVDGGVVRIMRVFYAGRDFQDESWDGSD